MARRRARAKKEVSLFPFLDILGCLIGSLILIITTVVLEQMDSAPLAEAAKVDDIKRQAAREAARRRELEDRLARARAEAERKAGPAEQRLAAARTRAEEAARRADDAKRRLEAAEKLAVDAPKPPPAVDTAALVTRRKQAEAAAAKLKAEIARRKKPPEQSIVVLPPGKGGGPKRGVFVEAAKDRAVVHDPKKPWDVPHAKLASDPRLKELFARTAADKAAIVTFLIRPDGVATYGQLQKAADAAKARSGRVPLPGSGPIDLSGTR